MCFSVGSYRDRVFIRGSQVVRLRSYGVRLKFVCVLAGFTVHVRSYGVRVTSYGVRLHSNSSVCRPHA